MQTDATSRNIVACCWDFFVQQCCVRLRGPKILTGFKLYATSANIVVVPCNRTQHVGPVYMGLYIMIFKKRSERFHWAWIVVQKRKIYSTINDENKYKSKDHLFIYFQNFRFNFVVSERNVHNFADISGPGTAEQLWDWGGGDDWILGGGGTIHFFLLTLYNFKNIGGAHAPLPPLRRSPCGRNFISSFGHFWAELFYRWGGGERGARAPSATPLRTRLNTMWMR